MAFGNVIKSIHLSISLSNESFIINIIDNYKILLSRKLFNLSPSKLFQMEPIQLRRGLFSCWNGYCNTFWNIKVNVFHLRSMLIPISILENRTPIQVLERYWYLTRDQSNHSNGSFFINFNLSVIINLVLPYPASAGHSGRLWWSWNWKITSAP